MCFLFMSVTLGQSYVIWLMYYALIEEIINPNEYRMMWFLRI